jgi:hypothetical protein
MLLFADSFDDYHNDIKYLYATGAGWISPNSVSWIYLDIDTTGGRTGERTFKVSTNWGGNENYGIYRRVSQGGRSEVRFAFWLRRYDMGTTISQQGAVVQCCTVVGAANGALGLTAAGRVIAFAAGLNGSNSSASLASGSIDCMDGGWHYIEVAVKHDAVNGYYKVWVDTTLDIDFSGNTIASGDGVIHGLRLTAPYTSTAPRGFFLDDLLCWDDTDIGDGFIGHLDGVRIIKTVRPTSDASVQFTPSSGTDNFSLVNQALLNLSSYVESATDGHTDRYGFGTSGLVDVTIKEVIVEANVANPGAGSINAKIVAELDATIAESAPITVPGLASPRQACFPAKPGGGAWSIADVDAATYGIRVSVP